MTNRCLTTGLAVLLAVFLTACQPAEQRQARQPAVDTAEVTATLDSLRSAFVDAYEAGDAETIASLWAEDGIISAPGAEPVQGRDSIRALIEQDPALGMATVEMSPLDVRVLDRDWAYEMGMMTVRFTPQGADRQQTLDISYLNVLHRTPDGWKYYREAYNVDESPGGR